MIDVVVLVFIFSLLSFSIYAIYKNSSSENSFKSNKNSKDEPTIEQIKKYRESKQIVNAFNLAKRYLSQNPKSDQARYMYSLVLFDIGKFYDAIGHLANIIGKGTSDLDVLNLMGECYVKTKQNRKAILIYKQILHLEGGNHVPSIIKLAKLHSGLDEKGTAIAYWRKLANSTTDENEKLDYYLNILKLHSEMKEWDAVIEDCNSMLAEHNSNKQILQYLKKAYLTKNDTINAIEILKQLIIIEPYEVKYYEDIIALLYSINDVDQIVKFSKEALELKGASKSFIVNYLAKTYIKHNDFSQAQEVLQNALKTDHKNVDLKKTIADLSCAKNDYNSAIEIYEELMEIVHPSEIPDIRMGMSNVYFKYGVYLYKTNNFKEAFNKFNTAIEYNPSNPELYATMAKLNYKIKNYDESTKNYQSAIELNPKNANYYLGLANIYYEMDNYLKAKKYYQETTMLNPNCVIAHATLGIIHAKQQAPKLAIEEFIKALDIEPQNIDIRYNLALAYEISNNIPKAIDEYKKVLELNPDHHESANNLKLISNMT